jgi:hypothetical protein
MNRGFFSILLAFLCLTMSSQSRAYQEDQQIWGAWIARGKLSDNWLGYFEYQARYGQQGRQYDRLLVRPAVGYQISPLWQVHFGYAWTPTFQQQFNDENRYWQQSLYKEDLGWTRFSWRNRLEQRLIQGISGTSLRLREMVALQVALGSDWWRPSFWNELFINLNEVSPELRPGFEQNRLFLGVWLRLSDRVTTDIGYMNDYINRYAWDDRMNHNMVVYVYSDF